MPLKLIAQDITKIKADAIVADINPSLSNEGEMFNVGDVKITKAYSSAHQYIIYTAYPRHNSETHNEENLLESCYQKALTLALENKCESVLFPIISENEYGYPKEQVLRIATNTISEFLWKNDMTVYISFDTMQLTNGKKAHSDIEKYIETNYVNNEMNDNEKSLQQKEILKNSHKNMIPMILSATTSLYIQNKILCNIDESFSEMLLSEIDKRGITDSECYKKANIDRKHFSKIRSDKNYRPSKSTVLALAIGLELSLEDTHRLLMKAGFALSHSFKLDLIVEYFISKGKYDIYEINEVLFDMNEPTLGH